MKLISQERGYHMKIYFVRHGETLWNKEKKIQGQSDIPLNEYGIELAMLLLMQSKIFLLTLFTPAHCLEQKKLQIF